MYSVLPDGGPNKAQWRIDCFFGIDTSEAEGQTGQGYSTDCMNVTTENGALSALPGYEPFCIPTPVNGLTRTINNINDNVTSMGLYYPLLGASFDYYLMICSAGGSIYSLKIDSNETTPVPLTISGYTITAYDAQFVQFRQGNEDWSLVFSPYEQALKVNSSRVVSYLNVYAPRAASACVHYGRVFACGMYDEPYNIRFSGLRDCTDWVGTTAGYITILSERGPLIKTISFLDHVYIFHKYGISRLTAYSRESEFSVSKVLLTTSEILADTIVDCGDRVIFSTRDGLYEFNGSSIRRICRRLDGRWKEISSFSEMKACRWGSKYVLALPLACTGVMPNTLIYYDFMSGSIELGQNGRIYSLYTLNCPGYEKLLVSTEGNSLRQSNQYAVTPGASWRSACTDLGRPDTIKKLRDLYLVLSGNGTIWADVWADGKSMSTEITCPTETNVVRLDLKGLSGRRLYVGVHTEDGSSFVIESITVRMDMEKDGG